MNCAGLPMYDHPCLRDLIDAWWAGLARAFAAEGIDDVPQGLDRSGSRDTLWRAPDLLMSQTCGYPLINAYRDALALLATPCYAAHGAGAGQYCSLIVVAADDAVDDIADLRGTVAAVNSMDSQSGMNVLRYTVASLATDGQFFSNVVISGNHAASIELIRRGKADVAAIDCVSHALYAKHEPETLQCTRVLAETESAPALPYVTGIEVDTDLKQRLRAGLARAVADPALQAVREALLIDDFIDVPLESYQRMNDMEREAERFGYPVLV